MQYANYEIVKLTKKQKKKKAINEIKKACKEWKEQNKCMHRLANIEEDHKYFNYHHWLT